MKKWQESTEKYAIVAIKVLKSLSFGWNCMKIAQIPTLFVRKVSKLKFGGEEGLNVFRTLNATLPFSKMGGNLVLNFFLNF